MAETGRGRQRDTDRGASPAQRQQVHKHSLRKHGEERKEGKGVVRSQRKKQS